MSMNKYKGIKNTFEWLKPFLIPDKLYAFVNELFTY
jgi:hypothetical protein